MSEARRWGGLRSLSNRASWGVADQVLSSFTNLALTISVARVGTAQEFGSFALVIVTYLVVVGVAQGLVAQPFAVRYAAAGRQARRRAIPQAAGSALLLGVAGGAACATVGFLLRGSLGEQLWALGITLPGLLLQDTWRFLFVAVGRPARAAFNDAVWALMQGVGFALVLTTGTASPPLLIVLWGIGACVGAALGGLQAGQLPSLTGLAAWIRANHRLSFRFAAESLVIRGSIQLLYVAIGWIAGLAAAGSVRGAQVVFSPLTLAYQAILFVAVPEGVRMIRSSPRSFSRFVLLISVGGTAIAIGWSLVAFGLPAPAGRQALGSTWETARPLLLPMAVLNAAVALSLGPQVGLRAMAAAGRCLGTDIFQATFLLLGSSVGAFVGGAYAAASGMATGTLLAAMIWWLMVLSATSPNLAQPMPEEALNGAGT
jgi:hypothetical protein